MSEQARSKSNNENCENIPTHTSKYEDAFHVVSNTDYKSHNKDNCLNQEEHMICHSNELDVISNPNTPVISTMSSLDSTNKLPESQESSCVTLEESLTKETKSINDDNKNIYTTDETKDIERSHGSKADTEITNNVTESCEDRNNLVDVNLANLGNVEEQNEYLNESAVIVTAVTSDIGISNELNLEVDSNTDSRNLLEYEVKSADNDRLVDNDSNLDDGSKTYSDDNIVNDKSIKDGTKSDELQLSEGSDKSVVEDESFIVDNSVKDERKELASEDNNVHTMDCTDAW